MTDRVDSLTIDTIIEDWKQYPDIVLDICHDLLDARSEVQRLQAVVDAVQSLECVTFPDLLMLDNIRWMCRHCGGVWKVYGTQQHKDTCTGVRLANALAVVGKEAG